MLKKIITLCLLICIFSVIFISMPVNAEINTPTENDLLNNAFESSVNKDYQGAVDALLKILSLYPETKNEDVYYKLCDLYDSNMYDYEKALEMYRKYLQLFPQGRFVVNFQDRLNYLEKYSADWGVIKEFKILKDTHDKRTVPENIAKAEELLIKYPNTSLKADILKWIASDYLSINKLTKAKEFMDMYFQTIPENSNSLEDQTAIVQYVGIASRLHKFGLAYEYLNKLPHKDAGELVQYNENLRILREDQRSWIGLLLSISIIVLALILAVVLIISKKRWKTINIKKSVFSLISFFVIAILLVIFTVLARQFVIIYGFGPFPVFYNLTFASIGALILIKLLAPLVQKYNRVTYLIVSFLVVCAFAYIAFFKSDNLAVFYSLPEEWNPW